MTSGKQDIISSLICELEILQASGMSHVPYESVQVMPAHPEAQTPLSPAPLVSHVSTKKDALLTLRNLVLPCVKCHELSATRHSVVFGSGKASAELVFVGEAPGFDEDQEGLPFVGNAGQLLTKMIEAMGVTRRDVFICNVLKCRPPQNRSPKPDEIENCSPYLWKQLEIIRPKLICALGAFAAQTLLSSTKPISQLRGKVHEIQNYRVICTFHPAYLLRNPNDKKKSWDDLRLVMKELAWTAPSR